MKERLSAEFVPAVGAALWAAEGGGCALAADGDAAFTALVGDVAYTT